jgi:hypothetical protein
MKIKDLKLLLNGLADDMDVVLNSNSTTYNEYVNIVVIKARYDYYTESYHRVKNDDDEDWRRENKEVLLIC